MRLSSHIPEDGYTASMLGTERTGNGVVIRDDGLIVTIGYLITEAESIWITTHDNRVVQGHPLAYDFATGMGLVLPLGPLDAAHVTLGSAANAAVDDEVFVIGHGGRGHALKAEIFARREFAGYWEYLLDVALFTSPPHPEWSGAALLDREGRLIGIGSLFVQEAAGDEVKKGNMFVPIDVLRADPRRHGQDRARRSGRRGRGSACTRARTTSASWSAASPRAGRRSARACARAISSSRSADSASDRSPSSFAPCGTSARRAA